MKTALLSLCCMLVMNLPSIGSSLTDIAPETVTLEAKSFKVAATVNFSQRKLTEMDVIIDGKASKVSIEDLEGIGDVNPYSVRLLTVFNGGEISKEAPKGTFMVTMDYGPSRHHIAEDGKEIIVVQSTVRFIFENGQYLKRETCIPGDNFKNEWKLFNKGKGLSEEFNGSEEHPESPLNR